MTRDEVVKGLVDMLKFQDDNRPGSCDAHFLREAIALLTLVGNAEIEAARGYVHEWAAREASIKERP